MKGLGEVEWASCSDTDLNACLQNTPAIGVTSRGYDLRLCGRVGLVRTDPVPWLYRDSVQEMPHEVVVLDVQCQELS